MNAATSKARIDWVDYAKGLCIILVVMMHSTLGVEKAAGETSWLNGFIEWAKPFRMPDFFLISGLFLASRIDKPWRSYLDSKVLHFAYFYVLWMSIQFALKGPGIAAEQGARAVIESYLMGFVEPFGTLWFLYMLAIFFVVAKLARPLPPLAVFLAAALLEILPIHTGWLLIDEFCSRFVYFFTGFWLAPLVFSFADRVHRGSLIAAGAGLILWGALNTYLVAQGLASMPLLGLGLGFLGAAAVVASGVLLTRVRLADPIRYCGEHSIVIYLAFFLFMAASRSVLLGTGVVSDLGTVALLVTAAGVAGPLLLHRAADWVGLRFLFSRPAWTWLAGERPDIARRLRLRAG